MGPGVHSPDRDTKASAGLREAACCCQTFVPLSSVPSHAHTVPPDPGFTAFKAAWGSRQPITKPQNRPPILPHKHTYPPDCTVHTVELQVATYSTVKKNAYRLFSVAKMCSAYTAANPVYLCPSNSYLSPSVVALHLDISCSFICVCLQQCQFYSFT